MRHLLWIIAFSAVILLITSTSEAQRNGKRRNPIRNQRPSISPYANLFRGDNGGLNSLYGFIFPELAHWNSQIKRHVNYKHSEVCCRKIRSSCSERFSRSTKPIRKRHPRIVRCCKCDHRAAPFADERAPSRTTRVSFLDLVSNSLLLLDLYPA